MEKETRLLIDDTRDEGNLVDMGLPGRVDIIARNYWTGKELLYNIVLGRWDVLYLDHDLNSFCTIDGREYTGYHIMCWIETMKPEHRPKKIICVSDNPPGRKRIEQVINVLYERSDDEQQDNGYAKMLCQHKNTEEIDDGLDGPNFPCFITTCKDCGKEL